MTDQSSMTPQQEQAWKCLAQPTADPPQDCSWPSCGCDPYANKVLAALEEAAPGLFAIERDNRELCTALSAAEGRIREVERERNGMLELMTTAERRAESAEAALMHLRAGMQQLITLWDARADEAIGVSSKLALRQCAMELSTLLREDVGRQGEENK